MKPAQADFRLCRCDFNRRSPKRKIRFPALQADPIDKPMLITLTQGHLTLLDRCPRKFQETYLEGLAVPPDPALQAGQLWGKQFHLLMQQYGLGLPVEELLAADPDLQQSFQALLAAAADLLQPETADFYQSEHTRSLACNGYVLTAIYDLLIVRSPTAEIVDWKTYLQPRDRPSLEQDWQTRLYRYILVETTDLPPEAVTMTYWFVRSRDPQTGTIAPQRVDLPYSAAQHDRTHRDLLRLTDALSTYQGPPPHFPQIPIEEGWCDRCPFALRCDRGGQGILAEAALHLPSLEEIEEIPI